MKVEYWTTYGGSDAAYERICSKCRTLDAALSDASTCEKIGGTRHRIYKVEQVKRPKKKRGKKTQ
jgi:hypothetical protein